MLEIKLAAIAALILILSGCATTIYPLHVYQKDSPAMIGEVVHDWSGSGEIRFTHSDGEKFTGHYTTVSPQIYHASIGGIVGTWGGAALAPGLSSTSTNMFYGLASLMGDRNTAVKCKYLGSITAVFSGAFNIVGGCKDSRDREFTVHMDSTSGARFENATVK